jgi:hypothetical protein
MSDKPEQSGRPIRLTILMLVGVLVGGAFLGAMGQTPLICLIGGALAGVALELWWRFITFEKI